MYLLVQVAGDTGWVVVNNMLMTPNSLSWQMDGLHPRCFGQGIAGHGWIAKVEPVEAESIEHEDSASELQGVIPYFAL